MKEVSLLRQRLPFGGLLFAAIVGILLAEWFGATTWLGVALLLLILPLLAVARRGGIAMAVTLATFAILHLWNWNEAPPRALGKWFEQHTGEYEVRGIVSQEPRIAPSGSMIFPLRVERIASLDQGKAITLPVTLQARWYGEDVTYGDRVLFRGVVSRPDGPRNPGAMDYRRWLERHGIFSRFRVDPSQPGVVESHGHGNPFLAWAGSARHRMERILSTDLEGAPEVLGAIKGICLGITDNAPEGFTDDFRFTGTMHLFSVSGLHVGMLAVLIWFVLKAARIPRVWAVVLTIPSLFFYVAVTGLKSGSIRSATMASILMIGLVLFRRSPLVNTLAAAAFLQLAIDTNTLFSAGWQFSYAVVLAILVAAPPIQHRVVGLYAPDPFLPPKLLTRGERVLFGFWREMAALFAVSAAAWIGSLIPTVAYFHLVSFSALGANLLAVPLAFGVLALGVLSLLGGTFSLWVAGAFNNANWLVTKLLLLVVQASALIPGGHWFLGPPGKPYPVMTILDLRGASCAVIRSGGEFALLDAGRRRDALSTVIPFLESSGANSIQTALITKSDASHLGGVAEIAHEIPIKKVELPASNGRSPVARKFSSEFPTAGRLQRGEEIVLATGVTARIMAGLPEKDSEAVVVRLTLGSRTVLMLPRPDAQALQVIAGIPERELHADILMIPLGGSDIATALGLIHKVAPRVVISPVDVLNRNGNPSSEWTTILREEGISFFRQDETGAVVIEADPKTPRIIPFVQRASSEVTLPISGGNPKTPRIE